ncbi:MAG TPA: cytochrome c [Usitatibacter sp.]|nr:cytochrome c [Usitatibacter sp.]
MHLKRILAAAALAACVPAAQADDNKLTLENRIAQCQGCHGIPDWKTAFPEVYRVPKLGGQKAAYIVSALKAYQSGDRDFPTMRAIAANLTDAEIDGVSKYYGGEAASSAPAAAAAPAATPATPAAAPAPAPAAATTPAPAAAPKGEKKK